MRDKEETPQLFDSHCHLDDRAYDGDCDQVIDRARQTGITRMMVVGVTPGSAAKAVALAEAHDGLFASVGIHPHDAKSCSEAAIDTLRQLAQSQKVRAWGETGLDFNRMFSPRQDQEKWFVRQIETAAELNLPLILHERDSAGRLLEILKNHLEPGQAGVVHCFSGSAKDLAAYLDLGFHIGITGILTVKTRGAELRRMVPSIPAARLLIETDAPYLTPTPQRNRFRRNEPAFVRTVFEKLVQVRGDDPAELAANLWENTCRLFSVTP